MIDFSAASLSELVAPGGHDCTCGRHHATQLKYLKIEPGAIRFLPEALRATHKRRPFVVCDQNTYAAAGEAVIGLLKAEGIPFSAYTYPPMAEKMEPDEMAVGSLTMAFDPACDVVLAVGSGVINDCCKVLAHAAGIPSMVVGTAPSMDGYASNSSSMVQNRIKVSLYNACPEAILCDIDIMKEAPMEMLLAGLGDMLAKYVSICEWRISNLVTGEYYCENIAGLMRTSVQKCMFAADGLVRRDPKAVAAVAEGLVLSGLAMGFAEVSRPASGLEHYFSHLWEMMALERGEASDLHGTQVGVGTAMTLRLLDAVREVQPDLDVARAAREQFDQAAWEAEARDIFGSSADTIIRAERDVFHLNDQKKRAARAETIVAHWPEIQRIFTEELPRTEAVLSKMESLGMRMTPKDLGISTEDTRRAFIGSRVIRDKYLTSTMLWDLGLLDAFAKTLQNA